MPTATCFMPDGSPVCHDNGRPLTYPRATPERARLSALKAWWPGSKNGLYKEAKDLDPAKMLPPTGAVIALDGVPSWRWERTPVFKDGELVGTRLDWVDLAQQARIEEEARELEAMRVKLGITTNELVGGKAVMADGTERKIARAPKGGGE